MWSFIYIYIYTCKHISLLLLKAEFLCLLWNVCSKHFILICCIVSDHTKKVDIEKKINMSSLKIDLETDEHSITFKLINIR